MADRKKKQDKGYRGPYERYKRNLEDNGAEIMMHGDEIYLREDVAGKMVYTHWRAKRGVLLYNWLAPHIDELRELTGEELPTPDLRPDAPDPESFAGLLAECMLQLRALSDDLDNEDEDREHPLNPLIRSWLIQLQVLNTLRERKTR